MLDQNEVSSRRSARRILSLLADTIDALTDEEYKMLVSGRAKLQFVAIVGRPERRTRPRVGFDLETVVRELKNAQTREDAGRLLDVSGAVTRADLVDVARALRVYVSKEDTVNHLKEKIIESVVGARLGSKAVATLPL